MNRKRNLRKATLTLLASLFLVISCVAVVWATCFETPKAQPPQSHCNLSGSYYEYMPDPPLDCGASINPYEGCQTATQPLEYQVTTYSNPDCTGTIIDQTKEIQDGRVEWDTAYVCCE